MSKSILREKSYAFAVRVVRSSQVLQSEKKEFVLSKQFLRSGTAIGALLQEAEFGQSRADFIHKLGISLKEANESAYWLCLMHDTGYLPKDLFVDLHASCKELIALLVASIKTAKGNGKWKAKNG